MEEIHREIYTLSHLSAHVVNHPKNSNGKFFLKNVTLQILNFILIS